MIALFKDDIQHISSLHKIGIHNGMADLSENTQNILNQK